MPVPGTATGPMPPLLAGPGTTSFSSQVPACVPSAIQSSEPFVSSEALNNVKTGIWIPLTMHAKPMTQEIRPYPIGKYRRKHGRPQSNG